MSFLTNLWAGFRFARHLSAPEQRSSLSAPSAELLAALNGGPTKSGATVSEATAFNVSAIRACVSLRASLLAMLPLKVYQRTPTGPAEQRDHPLSRLLRGRVSGAHTRYKWIHTSSVCHDLGGNAYARLYRNTYAEIQSIRWLKPAEVTPLIHPVNGTTAFRLAGQPRDLPQWEVLHIANLSTNGITGRSPLADLRESVGLALTAEEFTARSFANGNRKPGILVGGSGMTGAKAAEFLDFWMKNYAGAPNAGKNPLIYGGMDWKDAGFSMQDAELLGHRRFSIEEIARVYQLPLHLIGSTDKSTTWGSGIEQLNQGLVDYTLQPLCTNWEAELNTTLLTEREQDEGYYIRFSVDALLRGSPETRAKVYQIMRGLAAMDVNQIRRLEEWPEYPDAWAGDPRQPLNNQGGGGSPAAADQPADQPADPEADEAARAATENARRALVTAQRDDIVAAIRALPKSEVHVAAPSVIFQERSIVAETKFEPGALQVAAPEVHVAPAAVHFAKDSIHVENHIPPAGPRRLVKDARGGLLGIEDGPPVSPTPTKP